MLNINSLKIRLEMAKDQRRFSAITREELNVRAEEEEDLEIKEILIAGVAQIDKHLAEMDTLIEEVSIMIDSIDKQFGNPAK